MEDIAKIAEEIESKVYDYIKESQLKSVVMGISGGLDSGLNAVILKKVCKQLEIPFIGRFISIESNSVEESERADAIGKLFCDDYKNIDLTETYKQMLPVFEADVKSAKENDRECKIRKGNIKARLRMIYLYNLAQAFRGLVVDNDNMSEHLLGFFTLHGDVGDITPLASFLKTEVVEIADFYRDDVLETEDEKAALDAVIKCVPTDGLGITSSDVEQLGTKNYNEVDDILKSLTVKDEKMWADTYKILCKKYTKTAVDKVIKRHIGSGYKRMNPYRISVPGAFFVD